MSRKVFHLAVMVFALFSGFVASAQERTITGVVKDTNGQPLIGVTVLVKGTSRGTATDFDGNFSIQASTGETLAISATGMKSIDVPITSDKSFYEVTMETDVAQLKAVVVTGFDNVEERLFTGANSSITAEELKVDGVVDVSRMLEGKAAGVNVQNVSGTFGAGPKITIRGSSSIFGDTSPLFVVDGVVREDIVNLDFDQLTSGDATTLIGSSIAGINANDIQSIEILKDASATALYGARALNGIVVITTKSGRKESPTTISYTLEQSIRVTPSYSNYDILNSQETMGILKELESKGFLTQAGVVQSEAGGVYYRMYDRINTFNEDTGEFLLENTPEARNRFLQQYEMANTDWFETLFRQSLTQNHSLSFTGGGQNNSYYASVSFYNDPGLTIADEVNRVTTSFKNTFYLSDDFDLTLTGKASKREQRAPGTYAQSDDVVSGEISRNFDINPFSYALNTNRTIRPYDNQGNLEYVWDNYAPFNIINELQNNYIELDVLDALFQVDANWDITDELSYRLTASGRYVKTSNQHIVTEDANAAEAYRSMGTTIIRNSNPFLWSDPEDPTAQPISVLPYGGIYTKTDNTLESYYLRNTLNYQTKFNDIHDLVVLLGQDLRYVDRTETFFEGYGMQFKKGYVPNTDPNFFDKYIGEGGQYFGKSIDRIRTVAFFGKGTYAYDNRYVFAATGRYDGSNRQGQTSSSRWLPTWSVSGKWNATNESFLDNPDDVLSNLQVRASYGLTATAGPATNSLAIFRNDIIFRKLVSQRENVIFIDQLQNTDLTWEKQYELNLGIDLGFFDNRISMRADVYERQGFDLIDFVTTSGIGGQSIKAINNADMTTRGFEFSINSTNIKTEDFSWNTTLNYSMFDQEITKLSDRPNVLDMVDFTGGNVVGFPRNSLFSIDFAGLDDRGLPTFNIPGNNITGINFQDNENIFDYLVYEGPVAPDHSAGFNNTFQYKNWSLNVFISASWGNKIRLDPIYSSSYSDLDVFTGDFLNRWLLPGDENTTNIPVIADRRLLVQTPNLQAAYNAYNYSTERVADGGFVRMKNISLGYDFPKEMVNKLGLSTLSLKVLTTNPFLIYSDDKLNGQDPEFFQAGGVAYPILQQYTLSLNLSL
jgi:TonB-linked SusC/RagA family outer membrane protein